MRRPWAWSAGREQPSERRALLVTIANALLLAFPVVFLAWAGWRKRWVSEDAFITFRSVDNLLAGNGPVFNAGERVEASTSALWQFLLAVFGPVRTLVSLEWWSVILGLGMTLGGLVLAQRGALLLASTRRRGRLVVPFGALIVAALPPFWDFATSGLEMGLAFAWLGACFWALARDYVRHRMPTRDREPDYTPREDHGGAPSHRTRRAVATERTLPPRWVAVLVGLGPLIRPDFAVFSIGFALLLIFASRGQGLAPMLRTGAWIAVLPVAYELFRACYYAALTPTPALAKEAGLANWKQGLTYLGDLNRPYLLWLPLVVAVIVLCWKLATTARLGEREAVLLLAAPVLSGLLHATFVVRVGGDFMHGRLLLPAVFAILLPVSAVPFSWLTVPSVVTVGAWAGLCVSSLRVSYLGDLGPKGIADERGFYVRASGRPNPVEVGDYRRAFVHDWRPLRGDALRSVRYVNLVLTPSTTVVTLPFSSPLPARVGTTLGNVGVFGYGSGPEVYVGDKAGLADPLAARIRLSSVRTRPGHEKELVPAWYVARLVPADAEVPPEVASAEAIRAARSSLQCPPLRELLTAVQSDLTVRRALSNLFASPRLTNLRFAKDPVLAQRELCVEDESAVRKTSGLEGS